eukprot:61813_1
MQNSFLYLMIIVDIVFCILCTVILTLCINNLILKRRIEVKDKQIMTTNLDKHRSKHKNRIYKTPLIITYQPFTCYMTVLCLSLFLTIHVLTSITYGRRLVTGITLPTQHPIALSWVIMWMLSRSLMNSIFVFRLNHSFKDTQWMYSKCIFIMLYAVVIFIIMLVLFISFAVLYPPFYDSWIPLATLGLVILLVIVFYIVLTLLFYKRLFDVLKSYSHSYISFKHSQQKQRNADQAVETELSGFNTNTVKDETYSGSNIDRDTRVNMEYESLVLSNLYKRSEMSDGAVIDIKQGKDEYTKTIEKHKATFDRTKIRLMATSTQYIVLILVSLVSCICAFALFVVLKMISDIRGDDGIHLWHGFVMMLDATINCICLYLHFAFSLKWYRFLCVRRWCLHSLCMCCVENCVNKAI